jgi:hypothetical protein
MDLRVRLAVAMLLLLAIINLPSVNREAAGKAFRSCGFSLQSLVDSAAPGSTVSVPPCVYRETVIIDKPLTLSGQSGAEIRGSDVWSRWKKRGRYWVGGSVPAFTQREWPCEPDSDGRCRWPEQVFFDGQPRYQVAALQGPDSSRSMMTGG